MKRIKFIATKSSGEVSGLLNLPKDAEAILVFAHGAGAPMEHPFMENMSRHLAEKNIASLRYNFPYTEKKLKRIDPVPILHETVRSAVEAAKKYAEGLPIFAGGKSMGGRMTSQSCASKELNGVNGLIFFGFPLHAPGKDSTDRADHLFEVNIPMLFLQGTRDKLANLDLLKPIVSKLGTNASLHIIEGADHSFKMLKSVGKTEEEVLSELAQITADWMSSI